MDTGDVFMQVKLSSFPLVFVTPVLPSASSPHVSKLTEV